MHTDSFFRKGFSHQVCEDYALNSNEKLYTFIVADGCSSSEHTDIGARVLSWSAKEVVESIGEEIVNLSPAKIGRLIIDKAYISIKNLNIPVTSLDATLMIGFVNKYKNQVNILMYGDGALFVQNKKGEVEHKIIDYTDNTPFYLSYLLNSKRKDVFDNKEQKKTITSNEIVEYSDNLYVEKFIFDIDNTNWILLTTDGVTNVFNTESHLPIDQNILNKEITTFKNFSGEFIKRRIKRAFKNLNKDNFDNNDDFSVSGIFLGD